MDKSSLTRPQTKWQQQRFASCSNFETGTKTISVCGHSSGSRFHVTGNMTSERLKLLSFSHVRSMGLKASRLNQTPPNTIHTTTIENKPSKILIAQSYLKKTIQNFTIETPPQNPNAMPEQRMRLEALSVSRGVLWWMAGQMQMRRGFRG